MLGDLQWNEEGVNALIQLRVPLRRRFGVSLEHSFGFFRTVNRAYSCEKADYFG